MKRTVALLLAVGILAGLPATVGCHAGPTLHEPCGEGIASQMYGSCARNPELCQECCRCNPCDGICSRCSESRRLARVSERTAPPAPLGAVAYPYYTNRGPRDFLAKNPPSIGP